MSNNNQITLWTKYDFQKNVRRKHKSPAGDICCVLSLHSMWAQAQKCCGMCKPSEIPCWTQQSTKHTGALFLSRGFSSPYLPSRTLPQEPMICLPQSHSVKPSHSVFSCLFFSAASRCLWTCPNDRQKSHWYHLSIHTHSSLWIFRLSLRAGMFRAFLHLVCLKGWHRCQS